MEPPQMHLQVLVLLSAGMESSNTVDEPGDHGATIAGTQGAGVGVPLAASVAAATAGLDWVMHIPNEGMFIIGTMSRMLAAFCDPAVARCSGVTIIVVVPGGTASGHLRVAPLTTWNGTPNSQPPLAWISTRRFSAASGSSLLSSWLSPLPTAFRRDDATPFSVR